MKSELEVLKSVNKPLYLQGRQDVAYILACEKEGFSPQRIKALIEEKLPDSFLPDEKDLILQALEEESAAITASLS